MKEVDEYGFDKEWLSPKVQAEVYRQFGEDGHLCVDDEGYVLSHTAEDPEFCERLVKILLGQIKRSDKVLSIAEGQGHLLVALMNKGITNVQGVDICAENVVVAQKKNIPIIEADANHLVFADEEFDVVVINEAIGALGLSEALVEAKRVLKKLGKIIITAYDYVEHDEEDVSSTIVKYRYVLSSLIEQALKDNGFQYVEKRSTPIRMISDEEIQAGYISDMMDVIIAEK